MKKRDIKFVVFILLLSFSSLVTADIIDGNSSTEPYPRNLIHNSIVVGSDLNQSTSIINHSLIGLSGTSRLMTYTSSSKLVLRNTVLELDGNYTFSHGSLEILGNVTITGSGNWFTFGASSLLIQPNSSLIIDKGVTFEFATSNSISSFPVLVDKSSQIVLRDATLLVNNASYGLQLTNGRLVIEGNSIIDNVSTAWYAGLFLGSGKQSVLDTILQFAPGAQLNVVNAGIIWRNKSSSSFGLNNGTLNVASDSTFLYDPPFDMNNIHFVYDGPNLNTQVIKGELIAVTPPVSGALTEQAYYRSIISPDGSLVLTAFQDNSNQYYYRLYDTVQGAAVYSSLAEGTGNVGMSHGTWSPDGQYFAFGLAGSASGGQSILNVKRLVSSSNLVSVSTDFLLGDTGIITGIAFSPNGKYLACSTTDYGTSSSKNSLKVLKFNAYTSQFSLLADASQTDLSPVEGNPSGVTWTPDGNYIVVTGGETNNGSYDLQAFKFDGLTTTRVATVSPMGVGGSFSRGDWSPNGRLFAVGSSAGGTNTQYDTTLFIYLFDGKNFTLVSSYQHDAQIQAVKWSPDGKYVAFVSVLAFEPNLKIFSYSDEAGLQLLDNGFGIFPVVANDFSWSPDGSIIYVASDSEDTNNFFDTFSPVGIVYKNRESYMILENAHIKLKQDTALSNVNLRLG